MLVQHDETCQHMSTDHTDIMRQGGPKHADPKDADPKHGPKHALSWQTGSAPGGGGGGAIWGARNMTNPLSLTATTAAHCVQGSSRHDMQLAQIQCLLLLVHAGDIILVDSLSSNDAPHGIALSQDTAQLLLLALDLHLSLLQLALQALLVTLQEYSRLCKACTVWQYGGFSPHKLIHFSV